MLSEDLIASGANVECYYDAVGIGGQLVTVKLRSSDGCRVLARWYAHGLEVVQEVKMKPGGWR